MSSNRNDKPSSDAETVNTGQLGGPINHTLGVAFLSAAAYFYKVGGIPSTPTLIRLIAIYISGLS